MSSARKVAVFIGLGLLALAGWRLTGAILHAIETGTVLLGETTRTRSLRGVKWPYSVVDAWAYFAGWIAIGCCGILSTTASSRTLGRLLLVPVVCVAGFMLIAAAPMLGSVEGVVLFLTVFLGGSAMAVVIALWTTARADRQSHRESR
jgi:hypothetical protein